MKRLGVVGTLVWDRIWKAPEGPPHEGWGGIAYSLCALEAALGPEWQMVPLLRVGEDAWEAAAALLGTLARLAPEPPPLRVPEPNNRVELRYHDAERRCERPSGGVGRWEAEPLLARLDGVDALYVNFISGEELSLAAMQAVRSAFVGPVYADVHSLLLRQGPGGSRIPRPLPRWPEWLGCWDAVQLNGEELHTLADGADPERFRAELARSGPGLIFITRGAAGAEVLPGTGTAAAGRLAPAPPRGPTWKPTSATVSGDPTGCGDVWGATVFARLLAGDGWDLAMETAHAFAARNAARSGVAGLSEALRRVHG